MKMASETETDQTNCIRVPAPTAVSKPTSVWAMTPWQAWLTLWAKGDNNAAGPVNDRVRYATEDEAADEYPGHCWDGRAADTDGDAR